MAKQKINAYQQNFTTFSAISANSASNFTVSTGNTVDFQLSNTVFSRGSQLSVSGNTIVLGAGVTLVRVYSSIMAEGLSNGYLFTTIRKNGTEIQQGLNHGGGSGYASVVNVAIIPVAQGDALKLTINQNGSGTATIRASSSAFIVEVIG